MSKYKTPLQLYFDKVEDAVKENETSEQAEWGNEVESVLLNLYKKRYPDAIVSTPKKLFVSEKYPWMIGNIDGLSSDKAVLFTNLGSMQQESLPVGKKIIIECKTSLRYSEWGQPGTNEVPDDYLIQGAHYAIILDADRVDFAVSICGSPLRIYHYFRDEKIEKSIIETERYFWEEHVLKRVPPEPSSTEEAARLWREATGEVLTAPYELFLEHSNLKIIRDKIKKLQEDEEERKLKVQSFMKDSSLLVDEAGNKLFSWNNVERNSLNTEMLKEKYPDIYEECSKTIKTRMFLMKKLNIRD